MISWSFDLIRQSIKENIIERGRRLKDCFPSNLHYEFISFWEWLHNNSFTKAVCVELETSKSEFVKEDPEQYASRILSSPANFDTFYPYYFKLAENSKQLPVLYYFLLKVIYKMVCDEGANDYTIPTLIFNSGKPKQEIVIRFYQQLLEPLIHHISSKTERVSLNLYLLERYKYKCEWFENERLGYIYDETGREEDLDKDLRLFLFDQGIDYPISQPYSPSGKSDIVSLLETNDPLVLEVKVLDLSNRTSTKRNYGKNRIIDGFSQIVKYSNDFNKNVGYLVIFNMDNIDINLNLDNSLEYWPSSLVYAGKVYFFIVVNLPPKDAPTASNAGKLKTIEITEKELLITLA